MARADEFRNDGRTDESGDPCDENTHRNAPVRALFDGSKNRSLFGTRGSIGDGLCGYCVEIGKHVCRNLQGRRLKIFTKVAERRGSGDHRNVGRPMEQPRKRNLHGRSVEPRCGIRQGVRLQWTEPAQGKERNVGDALADKIRDQPVVNPIRQVGSVLIWRRDQLADQPASHRSERECGLRKDTSRSRTGAERSAGQRRGAIEIGRSQHAHGRSIVHVIEHIERLHTEAQCISAPRAS